MQARLRYQINSAAGARYCEGLASAVTSLSAPQSVLLDLLSSIRPVTPQRLTALTGDEWDQLAQMASEHRIGPVLDRQVRALGLDTIIPPAIAATWAAAYRRSGINALKVKRLIVDLKTILDQANIEFVALKGAWLAWHVYPDPALRPMRDVDILVRSENAIRAFTLLQSLGFRQQQEFSTTLEFALAHYKHLPGLLCPKGGKKLEVHSRLFYPQAEQTCPSELRDFEGIANDIVLIADDHGTFAYPAATATLIHVIVHATNDHVFNNGPLFFLDVWHILRTAEIDWPEFWQLAEAGGWTRACQLAFDWVEFYHGDQQIEWLNVARGETPQTMIEAAGALSLQDMTVKPNLQWTAKSKPATGVVARSLSIAHWIFFRHFTFANIRVIARTSPRAYLSYPRWLIRNIRDFKWGTREHRQQEAMATSMVSWLSSATE
jgi:hypothetical protein